MIAANPVTAKVRGLAGMRASSWKRARSEGIASPTMLAAIIPPAAAADKQSHGKGKRPDERGPCRQRPTNKGDERPNHETGDQVSSVADGSPDKQLVQRGTLRQSKHEREERA